MSMESMRKLNHRKKKNLSLKLLLLNQILIKMKKTLVAIIANIFTIPKT